MYNKLMEQAQELGNHIDTEWADDHIDDYDRFADAIEKAYSDGTITAREHDDLALVAFYDYDKFYDED